MRRFLAPAVAGLSLFMLAACGGGGGSGDGGGSTPPDQGITSPTDGQLHIDRKDPIVLVQERGKPPPAPVVVHMTYGMPDWALGIDDPLAIWLDTSPQPDHSGKQPLTFQFGVSAIAASMKQGRYSTTILFQEYDHNDAKRGARIVLPVTLILPHELGMQHSDISVIQGQDGSLATVHVPLQADGVNWSAKSDSPWLAVAQTSGSGSGLLDLHVADTTLAVGTHDATVTVTDVDNHIDEQMTVTVHVQPRSLVTRREGIGLTSAPGWNVLAASVPVLDGAGLSSTWSASSDQSWLVLDTPTGSSGNSLNVHADPSGLAAGMHYAQVTVTPTTTGVAGAQQIRIGLFVSTAPAADPSITRVPPSFGVQGFDTLTACDPIRPYCYSVDPSGVAVYNLFSGAVDATLPVRGFTGAVSGDGRTLYVADATQRQIVPVDLDSMTVGTALASADIPVQPPASPATYRFVTGRIGGRAVLVTNELHILDATTGQTLRDFSAQVPAYVVSPPGVAISHDGHQIMVRSLEKSVMYRMEVDADGSLLVGTTERHQEPAPDFRFQMPREFDFAADDASFLCTTDKIRRHSSTNLLEAVVDIADVSSGISPSRVDDSFYLFTQTLYDVTGNVLAHARVEHRSGDNQLLENVPAVPEIDDIRVASPQMLLSPDQHRLAIYTRQPSYFVDLP